MGHKLLLIGGGGHCKSVLDSLYQINDYEDIGIIDAKNKVGETVLDTHIVGTDQDLELLFESGYKKAFITIGGIGDPEIRMKLTAQAKKIGFDFPNIIDPSAVVSLYSELTNGIFVGKKAVINAGTYVGEGAIVNSSSTIEHDCYVEAFSHIAPGSILCGGVRIERETYIGAHSVIKQQVTVGSNTTIGMGSNVLRDVPSNILAYGSPCKEV